MAVEVERFNIDEHPEHGRPLVVRFTGKKGRLEVRVERSNGALWIFATGPQGGERGQVVVSPTRAGDAIAFTEAGPDGRYVLGGSDYRFSIRRPWRDREVDNVTTDRLVSMTRGTSLNSFTLRFEAPQLDELFTCLREWAGASLAATLPAPVVGEWFARGPLPGGTFDQQVAWLRAGPGVDRLARIVGAPGRDGVPEGTVRFALAHSSHGSIFELPLGLFFAAGWRKIG